MKATSPLQLAGAPPAPDERRKLSLALSLNLPRSTTTMQKNLLANSLAIKLKQPPHCDKENVSRPHNSKHSKRNVLSGVSAASTDTTNRRSKSVANSKRQDSSATLSTVKSNERASAQNEVLSIKQRVDSAPSDHTVKLSRRKSSAFNPSHRSSSAGTLVGRGTPHSGTTRMPSAASSFYHSSDSVGLALESRGADYSIKVMKKDGVFQPIDKYASSRYLARDVGPGERTAACAYEVFTLLGNHDDDTNLSKPNSQEIVLDGNRRPMKVSWSKHMDSGPGIGEFETLESRVESVPPSMTPNNNLVRILSSSSSYKRPIYSSGKSQVNSIGLRWRVPTAPPHEESIGVTIGQHPKKPMWSWLIAPEVTQKGRKTDAGQLSRDSKKSTPKVPQPMSRVSSNLDVRTQHSRDLHPVSTAMAREGTSVSKTKWLVPSSNTSTLEAERMAMDRLEYVRRESKIRPDYYNTYNDMADFDDTFRPIEPEDMDGNVIEDDDVEAPKRQMDDTRSYGTKSNADTSTSPCKSRSTYCYN